MSNLKALANRIPAEYRKEMLELNMIDSAKPVMGDKPMHYLSVVWKNYIEPNFEADCNLCLARVSTNMKAMKDILVQLEKEHQLLKSV